MTKPMTKLEACARKLAALEGANYDARDMTETACGNEPEEAREGYREQVRAVISELMEPSEEMELAGAKAMWAADEMLQASAGICLRAMLKAVLDETP